MKFFIYICSRLLRCLIQSISHIGIVFSQPELLQITNHPQFTIRRYQRIYTALRMCVVYLDICTICWTSSMLSPHNIRSIYNILISQHTKNQLGKIIRENNSAHFISIIINRRQTVCEINVLDFKCTINVRHTYFTTLYAMQQKTNVVTVKFQRENLYEDVKSLLYT